MVLNLVASHQHTSITFLWVLDSEIWNPSMQNTSADTSMQNTLSWLSWIPSGLKQKIYWNLLGFFWSFFPLKSRIHKWKTKRGQAQFEFWQYWKALPLKFRIWFRSIQVRFVCSKKSHPSTETPIWWIMLLQHFFYFHVQRMVKTHYYLKS